ncbi:23S rRNA (uracil-5-)-methyltransferase RumA [Selenomonas sp. oral taxon 892 str. F0426]|uniref:23S rRNA (uracil(1939)-C(5))-methyltransferase RlmD n=1 Tax=Selenomonas sp. oral taxon 892 TaxID=1321785 RepID=UPI0003AD2F8B|nr:23S rRNA (uracil(1939)-C(5))-methyltransferase RlmD [Selenomonas sp. oral taxon 892]ERJ92797.1 23S rRNA (uracil-5-)-methyltransferase RumA [Selenomonas sp. oral taxon 892 str. F0426]
MKHRKTIKQAAQTIPVCKGRTYELQIDRLGTSGEGVGRYDNFTVFVPNALPGENVSVIIEEVKNSYARGRIKQILHESVDRVAPLCELYEECGGCQLQHLSYEVQLRAKRAQVVDALTHIGKLPQIPVMETLRAEEPWNYRNKMQFPIGRNSGKIVIGCFAQGSHRIINTENCHIQRAENNDLANAVRAIAEHLHIPVYNEDTHKGVLRHIVGRVGRSNDLMAVIVTATKQLPRAKDFVRMMRERLPNLVSVHQNIQTYHNNVIMGRDTQLLWGRPTIIDSLGWLNFHISPRSFFQVNTRQAERLYKQALAYADLHGTETVIDAYCGTGTITLFLAQKARKVYGIEIVQPAILDARKNARDNHIKNAEFIVGDATAVMPALYKQGIRPNVVVVDPPRAGCTETVLRTFANMKPQRIVYVSCNPATLARDLAILKELGYLAQEVQPVDLFPQTSHVETVVLLSRT